MVKGEAVVRGREVARGAEEEPRHLERDVVRLEAGLRLGTPPAVPPALVAVSGLPGSGKSYFCRRLTERWPLVWLESDATRKLLFPAPTHSAEESSYLFAVLHALLERLLEKGYSAVLDATNLREAHRRRLYAIAERRGARLVLVRLRAPAKVVRQRLLSRAQGVDSTDRSDADVAVYERMRRRAQAIGRAHLVVDTSQDLEPWLSEVVRRLSGDEQRG